MKIDARKAILIALCMPMFSSCALFSPGKVETKKGVLSKMPIHLPQEKTRSAILLILAPETKSIYDTTQMAYVVRPYQVAYFSQNEWADTPSRMIQPLMVQTLQNYFRAVLTPPYFGHYTYALRTQILELKQDFTSDPPTVQLSMRFQLSGEATNQVIATKEISVREPMLEKTPYAGVVAANDATAKMLQELAEFVLEEISQEKCELGMYQSNILRKVSSLKMKWCLTAAPA